MRKERGITLIALVITIIVLLILAGVAIAMLSGENGILKKAAEAKTKTELGKKEEKTDLERMEELLNESTEGYSVEQVKDKDPGVLEGKGTESEPYVINSIEDLVFFAYDVRNGKTYEEKNVKLGLSLDFNSTKSYVEPYRTDYKKYGYDGELKTILTSGEGFKCIGTEIRDGNSQNYSFAGIFNGDGKTISNLYTNISFGTENANYQCALFGINYGTITKLGLVNCKISCSGEKCIEIGAFAGRNAGKISECYSSGIIKSDSLKVTRIGGISGSTNGGSITENCYNTINVELSIKNGTGAYLGGITRFACGK